jgi:hypothetical protein
MALRANLAYCHASASPSKPPNQNRDPGKVSLGKQAAGATRECERSVRSSRYAPSIILHCSAEVRGVPPCFGGSDSRSSIRPKPNDAVTRGDLSPTRCCSLAARTAWSGVHGLAMLAIDDPTGTRKAFLDHAAETVAPPVCAGFQKTIVATQSTSRKSKLPTEQTASAKPPANNSAASVRRSGVG